jgi:beta-glucosidase
MAFVGGFAILLTACTNNADTPDASTTPPASTSGSTAPPGETFTTKEVTDGKTTFVLVDNPGDGPTLSYGADSGFELLSETDNGLTYAFKDMNGNGTLDTWEDWRLTADERAADLVADLTIEQISGLMLYSVHQRSPADGLTADQESFLSEDNLRNILNAGGNIVKDQVTWANEIQAYVEQLAADSAYIPANFSSDPRSLAKDLIYFTEAGTGEDISRWPSNAGLAATFDADLVEQAGQYISDEYRALGIQVQLGPQIDLVTDPRWRRNFDTFGEDVELASTLAAAFVAGMQEGEETIQTQIKHFPGDGAGESGRESHQFFGKYAVYPGGNEMGGVPVFEAASAASQVMLSYSIAVAADGTAAFGDELVATAYDEAKIKVLREEVGFDGLIVTDWEITTTGDPADPDSLNTRRAWGVEDLTAAEQHYKAIKAGVDVFGGNNDVQPVLAAYELWQADYEAGKLDVDADTRWRESGHRSLRAIFQGGAYENPFVDLENALTVAGSEEKVQAGIEAQLASIVMLKNEDGTISQATLDDWADKTVYIPHTWSAGINSRSGEIEFIEKATIDVELAAKYFGKVLTDEPVLSEDGKAVTEYITPDISEADIVLVGLGAPENNLGYDTTTGTYIPISLQYRPYTADGDNVRKVSISGDKLEDGTQENRSYYGATGTVLNERDLDAFERAVAAVAATGKDIPIVTIIKTTGGSATVIPAEFEADSDAIFIGYGVAQEAYLQVVLGLYEPGGRLPIGLPASMDAIEGSFEDVPKDVASYVDSAGNTYEFGFGLNYSGPVTG